MLLDSPRSQRVLNVTKKGQRSESCGNRPIMAPIGLNSPVTATNLFSVASSNKVGGSSSTLVNHALVNGRFQIRSTLFPPWRLPRPPQFFLSIKPFYFVISSDLSPISQKVFKKRQESTAKVFNFFSSQESFNHKHHIQIMRFAPA